MILKLNALVKDVIPAVGATNSGDIASAYGGALTEGSGSAGLFVGLRRPGRPLPGLGEFFDYGLSGEDAGAKFPAVLAWVNGFFVTQPDPPPALLAEPDGFPHLLPHPLP